MPVHRHNRAIVYNCAELNRTALRALYGLVILIALTGWTALVWLILDVKSESAMRTLPLTPNDEPPSSDPFIRGMELQRTFGKLLDKLTDTTPQERAFAIRILLTTGVVTNVVYAHEHTLLVLGPSFFNFSEEDQEHVVYLFWWYYYVMPLAEDEAPREDAVVVLANESGEIGQYTCTDGLQMK